MCEAITICAAVEGITDRAVATRLIQHVEATSGPVYGLNGKPDLRQNVNGYNHAARHAPWLVLVDLDQEADCPPPMLAQWVPAPAPKLCFRIAVRAVESWLIADTEALSEFLGVARSRIPQNPEALPAPKEALVNLARHSRRKAIREDMVPRPESGRSTGPAYPSRLIEFASSHWRPDSATQRADSLRRAIECLRHLVANA